MRHVTAVVLLVAAGLFAPAVSEALPLGAADDTAVRAVIEQYRRAWLANDSRAVVATFRPDAVLVPPSHSGAVSGQREIVAYWWPPAPPSTEITGFELEIETIDGAADLAVVRGHDRVLWVSHDGAKTQAAASRSRFLTVLRREGARWAIQLQSWYALPDE